MSLQAWIALGGLACVVVGGIITGVLHAIRTAYTFGQHSQRMDQAETDIKALRESDQRQDSKTELAVLTTMLSALKEQLQGVSETVAKRMDQFEHDMRGLLTGKIQPPRRRQAED